VAEAGVKFDQSAVGNIRKIAKFSDLIGNRTSDLACSIMPESTKLTGNSETSGQD
jgi:hypothetical protein